MVKHFLDIIEPSKRINIAPEVLAWLSKAQIHYPPMDENGCIKLSFYTQYLYDNGVINHWQKHCIDYYS